MKQLLDTLAQTEKAIHQYFGYEEDWKVLPIQDYTSFYWYIEGESVYYGDTPQEALLADVCYIDSILYGHDIHRKDDFTMIPVDTQTDGNQFLSIFDNTKEIQNFPNHP
jgi:hypothetical protein